MPELIKYAGQVIDDDDIRAVVEALKSDFLSQGPKIEEFERKIAEFTGSQYCVVVSNGTAALHLAVMALDLSKGNGGITSANTFLASANAMVYNHLIPDFADIQKDTFCMSPESLEEKINPHTEVVIPVHFAGQPADMRAIADIAKRNKMFIIEDASHAIGSRFSDGTPVGSCRYSHMTTFSFQPLKTITTGEGGAITTNDITLYERLRCLRNHGIVKDQTQHKFQSPGEYRPWYHEIQELGFNYRLTDFQASMGISQLKKIDRFIQKRREIVYQYREGFKNLKWLSMPIVKSGVFVAYHLYVVLIDFDGLKKSRGEVMKELYDKKVQTQVHYIPVHLQPFYREKFGFHEGDYPVAENYYGRCLSLPLHVGLTNENIQRVIDAVRNLNG